MKTSLRFTAALLASAVLASSALARPHFGHRAPRAAAPVQVTANADGSYTLPDGSVWQPPAIGESGAVAQPEAAILPPAGISRANEDGSIAFAASAMPVGLAIPFDGAVKLASVHAAVEQALETSSNAAPDRD